MSAEMRNRTRDELVVLLRRLGVAPAPVLDFCFDRSQSSAHLALCAVEEARAVLTARPAEASPLPLTTPLPCMLTTWRAILDALGLKNTETDRRTVRRLNETLDGPIRTGGSGEQPLVDKTKLLAWWADLERLYDEKQQRKRNKRATVEGRHNCGRTGEVVPDLGGGVRRRRRSQPKKGT
jgi:hypothetical protein